MSAIRSYYESELIAEDIHAYLKSQEEKGLLRFITCGSVDDGKSTLIGRLLCRITSYNVCYTKLLRSNPRALQFSLQEVVE